MLEPISCLRPDTRQRYVWISVSKVHAAPSEDVADIVDIEDPAVVVEKAGLPVEFIPHMCATYIHIVRCVAPFLPLNGHFEIRGGTIG